MGAGRGRRTGLLFFIIILILLVGGGAAAYYLLVLTPPPADGTVEGEATEAPVPTTEDIIVALKDIRRGTTFTDGNIGEFLTTFKWPIGTAKPLGALVVSVGDPNLPGIEQVVGRTARVDILVNQPVLDNMLTAPGQGGALQQSGSDAALLIPTNMVAIAFPMDGFNSVAYAIRPGDHIDLLMSFRFVDVDPEFQSALPNGIEAILLPNAPTPFNTVPQDNNLIEIPFNGRDEPGPFNGSVLIIPSEIQRPRQATQLVIDNVVVMRVGAWPLTDIDQPIVVTEAPAATQEAGAATPTPVPAEAGGATPTPLPGPNVVTLIMSRQDALVLKYSLEVGADIDMALRSAFDNNVEVELPDTVTLDYILTVYGVEEPLGLPIAIDTRIDSFLTPPNGNFPLLVTPAP